MRKHGICVLVIGFCAAMLAVSGCAPTVGVECGPGWCSEVEVCVGPQTAAPACVRRTCGNAHVDEGEECDDANNDSGDGCSRNCSVERCGNGVLDLNEQCDDGNIADGDGCTAGCQLPSCGNGVVDRPYEQCDDGNNAIGDGCSASCTIEVCGNSILDVGEECDDGNHRAGDGCSQRCAFEFCGDGVVGPHEACDPRDAPEICNVDCTLSRCGDGKVNPFAVPAEQCDDGNSDDGDGCSAACTFENRIGMLGYLKASNTDQNDQFGFSIALSADGSTLAIGAVSEASAATGVDGEQTDNSAASAGAVYVFTRSGATWRQQAYIKASNTSPGDSFGSSVALSADGATLAVGAIGESSAARGIDGDQVDDSAAGAGAVYVFARSGATWHQQVYVKASNTGAGDQFGFRVVLSADGSSLAVGAVGESSAAAGIGGDQADNTATEAGAVYVFTRSGATWSQQAYIKASNPSPGDLFGASVALSADGSTLAVGAWFESSAARGIGGDQTDEAAPQAGAVYVFTRGSGMWSQQAYIKASNTDKGDRFSRSVALSSDGSILAVGAFSESSAATGIHGDQADNTAPEAGAVYVFTRSGAAWGQQAYIKASNADPGDQFGVSVALSASGSTLAVGAYTESSAATDIGGDQADNLAPGAGAVYTFTRSGATWRQQVYVKASNPDSSDLFGWSVALSADASTLAIGIRFESSNATGIGGNQSDNSAPLAGAVSVLY